MAVGAEPATRRCQGKQAIIHSTAILREPGFLVFTRDDCSSADATENIDIPEKMPVIKDTAAWNTITKLVNRDHSIAVT